MTVLINKEKTEVEKIESPTILNAIDYLIETGAKSLILTNGIEVEVIK